MIERLGNIFYWAGIIISIFIVCIHRNGDFKVAALYGIIPFITGWALRYFLSGKTNLLP